jgi:(p)ppGpp synthase/HD superfamily hydrolase
MPYSVKVIVYATDDPKVLQRIRSAVEEGGARVQEFTIRAAADGGKELYVELRLSEPRSLSGIIRRVEAVNGAAVMAATEPREVRISKRVEG